MTAPAAKAFRRGCHRICTPEETWARIAPLLPMAGITRVADVTGLDVVGLPVWQAVRPCSRNLSVSQGKGATAAAARVSAAMEALELWHAEDLSHLPALRLRPSEVPAGEAVGPATLPGIPAAVPAAALAWKEAAAAAADEPLAWLRARSLVGGGDRLVPRELVELDFSHDLAGTPRPFHVTSSGLASGNCPAEALVHALCELVERDAVAWARDGGPRRPLDPATAADPDCVALAAAIRAAGMKLAVHDVTGPLGIPVVEAEIAAGDLPLAFRGSGCHPSRAVALSRALAEAAQSRLTYVSGARDDVQLGEAPADRLAYDALAEPAAGVALGALPDLATPTVDGDLARLLERLAAHGHEPFAVDLSRPEVGIAVVRVVAPTLRELRGHG